MPATTARVVYQETVLELLRDQPRQPRRRVIWRKLKRLWRRYIGQREAGVDRGEMVDSVSDCVCDMLEA